jgi:enamine deaminase RidA (YjgF/YER057c/UK114 family)
MTMAPRRARSATQRISARLRALQLSLPAAPTPAGAYSPVIVRQSIGFVSGQFPLLAGNLVHRGRVGKELSIEQGRHAAEVAALNVLAQIQAHGAGFDRFGGLLRVEGYVASAPGFVAQPRILDAASELLVSILGPDLGAHARTAFSVEQLPLDAPVELCVSFTLARTRTPVMRDR